MKRNFLTGTILLSLLLTGCLAKTDAVSEPIEETRDTSVYYMAGHINEQDKWAYSTQDVILNAVQAANLLEAVYTFPKDGFSFHLKETQKDERPFRRYLFEEQYKGIPVYGETFIVTAYPDGTTVEGTFHEGPFPEEGTFLSRDVIIDDYLYENSVDFDDWEYIGLCYFPKNDTYYFCHALLIYPDGAANTELVMLNALAGNTEAVIPKAFSWEE